MLKKAILILLSFSGLSCSSHKSEFGQNFNPGQCSEASSEEFISEFIQFNQQVACSKIRSQSRQLSRVARCFELSNNYDQLILSRSYLNRMGHHHIYRECLNSGELQEINQHVIRLKNILKEKSNEELIRAVWRGDRQKVSLLLEGLADINYKTANGFTPLIFSIRHNRDAISKLLLEKGANPILKSRGGLTALDYARESGNRVLQEKISRILKVMP